MQVDIVKEFADQSWDSPSAAMKSRGREDVLETGNVLYFPKLRFGLDAREERFLSDRWSDGKSKNISLRRQGANSVLRGGEGSPDDLEALRAMMQRFADSAELLVKRSFPVYQPAIRRGFTSFRPHAVSGRETSWRKDDTRLHVDSFPSNPTGGARLLRVFTNVHPDAEPRVWRVGEPFEELARKFLPKVKRYSPGAARLMKTAGITKSLRTEYDHIMLQFHDLAKADMDYQRNSPQQSFGFPPGSTWIVYSDQVQHAVSSGQFLLEQTFYLEADDLANAETAPLSVLERLTNRRLI